MHYTMSDHINALQLDMRNIQSKVDYIHKLLETYPDAEYDREYGLICAPSVNLLADQVTYTGPTYGWGDLLALPYYVREGKEMICSSPCAFKIAAYQGGEDFVPCPGYQEEMKKACISEKAIAQVDEYLENQRNARKKELLERRNKIDEELAGMEKTNK